MLTGGLTGAAGVFRLVPVSSLAHSGAAMSPALVALPLVLVGLGLIMLMVFRPQGAFGNRKEMALDGR